MSTYRPEAYRLRLTADERAAVGKGRRGRGNLGYVGW